MYELYAVLVHSGSASFGHYYALIKDLEHGEWHEFNDSNVKPIKESELQRAWGSATASSSWSSTSSAYMLLYRRCADARTLVVVEPASASQFSATAATHSDGVGGGDGATRLLAQQMPANADGDECKAKQDFKRLRLTPPRNGAPDSSSRLHTQPASGADGEAIRMADLNEDPFAVDVTANADESAGNPYFW